MYIIPGLRYKDAPAAIDFLCDAFGFTRHMVVEEDGKVPHAQLKLGDAMIMLGSVRDDAFGNHIGHPQDAGVNTQAAYVVVRDIKAHYENAIAAGAEIIMELEEQGYGGAVYSCKDLEGYLWSFGSYDPFAPTGP